MQTRLEDPVSLPPPGTPEGSSSERGQSPGASASGPFLLGLAAGLCGTRGFVITKEACFPSVTQSTALGSSVISFITLDFY